MKYIVQIYEGEVNGHGERKGLPTDYKYEFEQEKLNHIHKLKKELRVLINQMIPFLFVMKNIDLSLLNKCEKLTLIQNL